MVKKSRIRARISERTESALLDEPTNHLDIETILWLEKFLKDFQGSIVFISHDRSFIRNMATRIIDLDRGKLSSWPGNYDKYLESKEEALRVEEQTKMLSLTEISARRSMDTSRIKSSPDS